MLQKIQIFLEKYNMIEKGDHVIAGISGGADSVCLLLILKELQKRLPFVLTAVHVEHGIRGEESLRDEAFVEAFCRTEEIELRCFRVDAQRVAQERHMTLEEAARELRYGCFYEAAKQCGAKRIAVAHHGDDCAETMLFHLSRGTGLRGLCGITPVRNVPEVAGCSIIRPLLCVTRSEIEQYLQMRGQDYCTDSTNEDVAYARNRIRHNILPQMTQINPQSVQHMVRTAGYLEEMCDYLEEMAWEVGKEGVICSYKKENLREISLMSSVFEGMHPVLQKNLIHQLLGKMAGSRKDITGKHISAVCQLFALQVGKNVSLPYGLSARRSYEGIVIEKRETGQENAEREEVVLSVPGDTIYDGIWKFHTEILEFDGNYEKIPQKTYTKWFDYDKINNTVLVRNRAPGDYFSMPGGCKKLKNFFIDEKIPQAEREQIPLLADADHVIWIVGWRISEAYKVTQKTKRILAVCADGGKENE